MKYERQRHSQLFIALQEGKKKIEKAATPYTPEWASFLHSCRGIASSFTMCNVIAAGGRSGRQIPLITPPPPVLHSCWEKPLVTSETHLRLSAAFARAAKSA